ncbi:MAG: hypothetical protein LBP75_02465, partial [Planctomycetota bacterium]|nr:hypothetical protein [Planctomycetota bacterium]
MVTQTTTSANDLFSQEMRLIHELRESQKETDRILQETARELQELGKKIQATTENVNGGKVEIEDLKKAIQATTENVNGGKIEMADVWKAIKATTENVNGIAKSNGMFAEEYFFNALAAKQTFGGIHFDSVQRNRERIRRLPDGQRLQSEFDVQLT